MANAIKSFCKSLIKGASAIEEAGLQLTEAVAVQITPMRLIIVMSVLIGGAFLQVRHERMVDDNCDLRMQIQALQDPAGGSESSSRSETETFHVCVKRLGGR